MHTASREWADRVAARNAVETAKARADEARKNEALAAQGFLPLTYGEQLIPLSAAGKEAEPLSPEAELAATVARQKEESAQ